MIAIVITDDLDNNNHATIKQQDLIKKINDDLPYGHEVVSGLPTGDMQLANVESNKINSQKRELPQTGNDHTSQSAIVGLALGALAATLGLTGVKEETP